MLILKSSSSLFSERPLHGSMKLWPLIHEWQNWSKEYSAHACLCIKSSDMSRKIENAVRTFSIKVY